MPVMEPKEAKTKADTYMIYYFMTHLIALITSQVVISASEANDLFYSLGKLIKNHRWQKLVCSYRLLSLYDVAFFLIISLKIILSYCL